MIIYFSGTGNSKYVACKLASLIGECAISLSENPNLSLGRDVSVLGIVCPVYAWGIPPYILHWIKNQTGKHKPSYIWATLCCGDETGNAPKILRKAIEKAGLRLNAVYSVQMPNNYVLLPGFDVDPQSVEKKKLEECDDRIREVAKKIKRRESGVEDIVKGEWAWLKTTLVYPLFCKWGISAKKWKVDSNKCISCRECQRKCPVGNINFKPCIAGDKTIPEWGERCESCLACYHICPVKAISYGNITKNKGQYFNRLKI